MPEYIIREAQPDDAESLIAFINIIFDEPHNGTLRSSASEFNVTPERERTILEDFLKADNKLYIVLEAGGQIVGQAHCRPIRDLAACRHTVGMGITIAKEWRNQGIGSEMMQYIVEWCRDNPLVKRLELEVFSNNPRAVHVYEKFGFQHEGLHRQAIYKHGEFLDVVQMAIVFDHKDVDISR